jgi:hypothetical protein
VCWLKAIAEGMFWLSCRDSSVCVPFMLDEGKRGFTGDEFKNILQVEAILKDQFVLIICKKMRQAGLENILDLFEEEIKKLLQS